MTENPTGVWKPGIRSLCNPEPLDECDCGYVGLWEHRWWYEWHEDPTGKRRPDWLIRRDIKIGLPARANDSGHWIVGGYDERCPECRDVERFEWKSFTELNQIDRWHGESARVVSLAAKRRIRAAAGSTGGTNDAG